MINKISQIALALTLMIAMLSDANAEIPKTGKYKIDADHTTVLFTISHLGFSDMTGRFNNFEGNLILNPAGKSRVDFTIQTSSVDSNHAKRDKHLRSPDFLNTKQFPQMHFVSKKVSFNKQGELDKVMGNLTLHGKTNAVTLDIKPVGAGKDPWGGYRAGYNATTVIKRSDYGMNFMPGGVGDDIAITLNIEAIEQ